MVYYKSVSERNKIIVLTTKKVLTRRNGRRTFRKREGKQKMKSAEVATELRRLADALDKEPELEISPYLSIDADTSKETFLALARIMPRPMEKGIDFPNTDYSDFKLEHGFWKIKVAQSAMCILVEPARPARYECPSILSPEEEEALGVF
jgi:hypothetical protein